MARIEARLGAEGRVVLRASGTEPVIRVMVEGRDEATTRAAAAELAEVVRGSAPAEGASPGALAGLVAPSSKAASGRPARRRCVAPPASLSSRAL